MISVVVPIYNVENYLDECLKSIITQTYTDIEVLCVDDCTLDNSINIVKKYMRVDPRIKLISHEENRGLGGARNTGIRFAQGEYIAFVDSDDKLDATALDKCHDAITKYDVDAVVFGLNQLWSENEQSTHSAFHMQILPGSRVYNIADHKERLVEMWPSAWNKLYKTELIRAYGCCFPEKLLYEDHFFFYNYFAHVKAFYYIDEALYHYRVSRPGSITSAANGRENEVYKVLTDLEPVFQNTFPEDIWCKSFARVCFRLIWERQNLFLASLDDWKAFCSNAQKWLKERFDLKMLEDAVDPSINRMDAFYRYVFLYGRKKFIFRLKLSLKGKRLVTRLHAVYKKMREYRTIRSYVKELIWVCWNNKKQIENLIRSTERSNENTVL